MAANSATRSPAEAATLDALAHDLARALGSDVTLPSAAARRATVDPMYLAELIGARGDPAALADLVARAERQGLPKWAPPPTARLIAEAGRAVARWAAAGFAPVGEDVAARRLAACRACPELRSHGGHLLYRAIGAGASGVCGMCACAVEKKVRLPSERCPASAPDGTGLSRWGEPMARDSA